MPSGAAKTQHTVMSTHPRSASSRQQCSSDPPVASIGSSTRTGSPVRSVGSDSMYARGWNVCSSRASPTKPIDDSGNSASAASAIPRPARSTGTIRGGLASRVPIGLGHRRGDRIGRHREGAGRLVDDHGGEFGQRGAKCRRIGADVTHRGESRLRERVVHDEYVHATQRTGSRVSFRARRNHPIVKITNRRRA